MFRKGIFFLILTGLLLCAGCAGRRPAEQGELVRMEAVGENPLHGSDQSRCRKTEVESGIIRKGGNHSNDGREEN